MARTRYRGRGTIRWAGHALDGVRVFLLQRLASGELLVRVQQPLPGPNQELWRVPAERFEREPDA